jgi:hypothetical protein
MLQLISVAAKLAEFYRSFGEGGLVFLDRLPEAIE